MKRSLLAPQARDKGSIAASIAIHAVVVLLIASITFRYPLASLFQHQVVPAEEVHYVAVKAAPRGAVGNGSQSTKPPKKALNPAELLPPKVIPSALPPIPPPNASVGAISGTSTGIGGAPAGMATGVEPAVPDPRIELRPNSLRLPSTTAQKNDSAVKAIFMAYREAEIEAEEHRGRDPKDWTISHNGQKYGLDSQYIYLGKFKVPSAILAALPLNPNGVDGRRIIDGREAAFIQNDIFSHAQGMSEDDFRAAVKRIRERKDREKKEEQDAKDKANNATKTNPIVP